MGNSLKTAKELQDEINILRKRNVELEKNLVNEKNLVLYYAENAKTADEIIETLVDGVVILDITGKVERFNRAFMELVKWKSGITGKTPTDFVVKEDAGMVTSKTKQVFSDGSVKDFECTLLTGNGEKIPVVVSAVLMKNPDGSLKGINAIIKDLSGIKKAERKLTEMEKQAEKALMENEEKYRALVENSVDSIFMIDREFKVVFVNDYAARQFKSVKEKITGKKVAELFPKQFAERQIASLRKVFNDKQILHAEECTKFPGGEVWLETKLIPVFDEDKNVKYVYGISSDITDRKHAEYRLQLERDRIRTILDQVGDPIFVKDNDHRITMANRAFYDIFCMDENNVIGYTLAEAVPENERQQFLEVDRRVLDTGIADIREEELTVGDLTRTIITRKTRFVDQSGGKSLVSSIHDITEKKNFEKKILRQVEYAGQLIDSLPGLFYQINPEGRFTRWNKNFETISGYSSEEMKEMSPLDLFDGDDKTLIYERIQQVFTHGVSSVEANFISKDGKKTPYYFSGKLVEIEGNPMLVGMGIDISDKKKTELELLALNEKLNLSLEAGNIGIWEWDIATNHVSWDERNEKMFGLLPGTFSGKYEDFTKLLSPDSVTLMEENIKITLENDTPYKVVLKGAGKNSNVKYYNAQAILVKSPDGRPEKMVGVSIDISDLKMAEIAIKKSEKELKILNEINQIFLTIDDNEMYSEVLKQVLKTTKSRFGVFGYIDEKGALIVPTMTRDIWDKCNVSEKSIEFPKETWGNSIWPRSIREKRTLYSNEASNLTPEGHIIVERNISCPVIHKEKVIGLLQIANKKVNYNKKDIQQIETFANNIAPVLSARIQRDIEEKTRKKAQENLKNANDRLVLAIEGGNIGIWEWELDSNLMIWNNKMHLMFGIEAGGFDNSYKMFRECVHPEDIGVTEDALQMAIDENIPFNIVYRVIWKSGDVRYIKAMAKVLYDNNNKATKMIGVCMDITEIKQTEEQLKKTMADFERSNKELEQFAYVASHDLQEPLRMVASFTQLLEKRYANQLDSDAKEFIGYAVDGANRMQKLINDLLDFSRITTRGKEFIKLDVSTVLANALANLHEKIRETGAMVTNVELPFIKGDESQLTRLFQNLIDNAIKFRGDLSPRIHISFLSLAGFWQISVNDNGIGINPEYKDRIFHIFQRLNNDTKYPGTGIGLAVCKRIVERHGGKIWVESEEGNGSTFYFTLKK